MLRMRHLLLCLVILAVQPTLAKKFARISHPSYKEWCELKTDFADGKLDVRSALAGLNVSIALHDYGTEKSGAWSTYDSSTDEWVGFVPDLFSRVAELGKFNLNITQVNHPATEDALFNQGIVIYGHTKIDTADNRAQGYLVPATFIDQSLVLVASVSTSEEGLGQVMFDFLKPFERDLWLLFLASVLFSALTMFSLERSPWKPKSSREEECGDFEGKLSEWKPFSLFKGTLLSWYHWTGWMLQ
jgi:hypothetical protein